MFTPLRRIKKSVFAFFSLRTAEQRMCPQEEGDIPASVETPRLWPGTRSSSSIIFLDFDGVLHPGQSGSFRYMPALCRILDEFPEVDVVLSTSWRESAPKEYLLSLFPEQYRCRIRDITPVGLVCNHAPSRQEEIMEYVQRNGVHRWIAVDDDESYFAPECPWLFLVDTHEALCEENEVALIARLKHLSRPMSSCEFNNTSIQSQMSQQSKDSKC